MFYNSSPPPPAPSPLPLPPPAPALLLSYLWPEAWIEDKPKEQA